MKDAGNRIFVPLFFESYRGHSIHPSQCHNSGQEIIQDTFARRNTHLDEFPVYETNPLCDSLSPEVPAGQITEVIDVKRHSNSAGRYSKSMHDALTNAMFDARSLVDFIDWRNIYINHAPLNPPDTPRTATAAPDNIHNASPPEAHVTPKGIFNRNTFRNCS